jgi:glycosyltransferase involved in cell wall biosynthesis
MIGPVLLVVNNTAEQSGADSALGRMLAGMLSLGWRVSLVIPNRSPVYEELERAGAHIHVLPLVRLKRGAGIGHHFRYVAGAARNGRHLHKLIKQLERDGPVVLYVNSIVNLMPMMYCAVSGRRCVLHVREFIKQRLIARVLFALACLAASRIVYVSRALSEYYAAFGTHRSTSVIYDGISSVAPSRDRIDLFRERYAIAPGDLLIGMATRVVEGKRVLDVARLYAEGVGRDAASPLRLCLIVTSAAGRQDYFAYVREQVRRWNESLPPQRRIIFHEGESNLSPLLPVLGCLVSATSKALSEGFGLAILEAMAQGVVVFATPYGAVGEQITAGVNGFLFEESALPQLFEMIERRWQAGEFPIVAERACGARARFPIETTISEWGSLLAQEIHAGNPRARTAAV